MAKGMMADRPEDVNNRGQRRGMFSTLKNDVLAMFGEFIGTVMFLLFALGAAQAVSRNTNSETVTDSTGNLTLRLFGWWYISAAFGLSLFVFSAIFYRFTGSIFNPSVSLALCICRVIGPVRFVLVAIAQMLGGIAASAILHGLTPGPLNVRVRLAGDTSRTRGVFIEAFATTALTLCVLMLAAEKSNLTPFAPLAFGMTLFVVMLFSIAFTGGAVNTARAFGPDVITRDFVSYHWIYWLGPAIGALVASGIYYALKAVGYWRVNPDQDSTNSYQSNMAGHGPGATHVNDGGRRNSDATYNNGANDKLGRASGANGAGNFGGNPATATGVHHPTAGTTGTTGMQTGNPTYPVGAQNV